MLKTQKQTRYVLAGNEHIPPAPSDTYQRWYFEEINEHGNVCHTMSVFMAKTFMSEFAAQQMIDEKRLQMVIVPIEVTIEMEVPQPDFEKSEILYDRLDAHGASLFELRQNWIIEESRIRNWAWMNSENIKERFGFETDDEILAFLEDVKNHSHELSNQILDWRYGKGQ